MLQLTLTTTNYFYRFPGEQYDVTESFFNNNSTAISWPESFSWPKSCVVSTSHTKNRLRWNELDKLMRKSKERTWWNSHELSEQQFPELPRAEEKRDIFQNVNQTPE